jgi:ParB family transcriptional regulator, chromosome partitioning protein
MANMNLKQKSETIPISQLQTHARFQGLFPIDPEVLEAVQESMKGMGFDPSKPIDVWKNKNIIVDGHTRYRAAKNVGLTEVCIFEHDFKDEEGAFQYAIANQRNRRNITDGWFFRLFLVTDRKKERGGNPFRAIASNEAIGKSAVKSAELIGTSATKVEKMRVVQSYGLTQEQNDLLADRLSLQQTYQKIKNRIRQKPKANPEEDVLLVQFSENAGKAQTYLKMVIRLLENPQSKKLLLKSKAFKSLLKIVRKLPK